MLKHAAAAALCLGGAFALGGSYVPAYPPVSELRSMPDGGGEDAAFLAVGMRKLGADINFIRLLQYYGSSDADLRARDAGEGAAHFPEFTPRLRHIMSLDPYFRYAVIYGTGVLAFNMERYDDALSILEEARRAMPNEWWYSKFIAAIGYSGAKDPGKAADMLDPFVNQPDTPVMLKQQAAFLNKRIGRTRRAYEIYSDIAATSSEAGYVANARHNMEVLGKQLK